MLTKTSLDAFQAQLSKFAGDLGFLGEADPEGRYRFSSRGLAAESSARAAQEARLRSESHLPGFLKRFSPGARQARGEQKQIKRELKGRLVEARSRLGAGDFPSRERALSDVAEHRSALGQRAGGLFAGPAPKAGLLSSLSPGGKRLLGAGVIGAAIYGGLKLRKAMKPAEEVYGYQQ